jgi:hypothetical protein
MPGFICHDCVGDAYLKAEIRKENSRQCTICGQTRESTDFDALCERIHEIISAEFEQTPGEPEYWPSDATTDPKVRE